MRSRFATLAALIVFATAMLQPALASSQQLPAAKPADIPSRLVILGTAGGPVARVNRSQPANVIVAGGKTYLVDAGEGVVRQLAAAGLKGGEVDAIFLTHLHLDHTAGLAPLVGFSWVAARKQPIEVIGPVGTRALVDGAIAFLKIPVALHAIQLPPAPSLQELLKVREVGTTGKQMVFEDANVKVWAFNNNHFDQFGATSPPLGTRSYSLRFEMQDRTVVFTGDTGYDPKLVDFAKGADVLVSEVIELEQTLRFLQDVYQLPLSALQAQVDHMQKEHISPEEIGRLANAANVKTVVLSHLVMGLDSERDSSAYAVGVKKYFSGTVIVANDLLEL